MEPSPEDSAIKHVPLLDIRKMHEQERAFNYFKFLFGMYEGLPDADLLRNELRCLRKKCQPPSPSEYVRGDTGGYSMGYDPVYFPLTDAGYVQAVEYIWAQRDGYEVINSILPRRLKPGQMYTNDGQPRGLMGNDGSPYCAVWAIDIDGVGEHGPIEGVTPLEAAREHMLAGIARGIPEPHMLVEGRNGYHLYWLMGEVTDISGREGNQLYHRSLERFCHWFSGEGDIPAGVDASGKRTKAGYSGAHADRQTTWPSSTLRPVGSYNHKTDRPRPVRLVRMADPSHLDLWPRHVWTTEKLPSLPDPPMPDPNERVVQGGFREIAPYQRRKLKPRVREWRSAGPQPGAFNQDMKNVVSDMQWCNYTLEETFGILAIGCQDEFQVERLRAYLWPAAGTRQRFEGGVWNEMVAEKDAVVEKDVPAEEVLRRARDIMR